MENKKSFWGPPSFSELFLKNRRWLGIALLIFLIGNLIGFLVTEALPVPKDTFQQESELSVIERIERIGAIYLHNLQCLLLSLFGGILIGFFPVISLLGLGEDVGIILSLSFSYKILGFALGILPHGIFEIPAVIIAGAWGLKLGWGWIKKPRKERKAFLKSTLKEGLYVFLLVSILLLIAAIIEGSLTPYFLNI